MRMTYVPKSTSVSASVTWTDEENADGLRPDYILAELCADGKPTGDIQAISSTGHWQTRWKNYPYYKDGERVEYTFRLVDTPEGYSVSYYGIYDTSGLSAVLTHSRILQDVAGKIIWNDRDNQASARPSRVSVQLYADGKPLSDRTAVFEKESDWHYTWTGLPVFRDGGTEITYSVKVTSDIGKYSALSRGTEIQMYYDIPVSDIGCRILWQDEHDADGARPDYLPVTLTVSGEKTVYSTVAQSNGTDTWYVEFSGFPKYDTAGRVIDYGITADELPPGYSAVYTSGALILERQKETTEVKGKITWDEAFSGWERMPRSIETAIWGYSAEDDRYTYLGAGTARASDGWNFSFENIPERDAVTAKKFTSYLLGFPQLEEYYEGTEMEGRWQHYVKMSYERPEAGEGIYLLDVILEPNAAYEDRNTTDYAVRIFWSDNGNANSSRTYGSVIRLTGTTDSSQKEFSYVVTADDISPESTTEHIFEDIPVFDDRGERYVYEAEITGVPENYSVEEHQSDGSSSSFTLVNVRDINVTAVWFDERDGDGVRPEKLTLYLYSDTAAADRYIFAESVEAEEICEAGGEDVWRYVFRDVPVWSSYNTDREVKYRFSIEQTEAEALEKSGYTADYREYAVSADVYSAGDETYHLDLKRMPETADVTASILWKDEKNRKGYRPDQISLILHADRGDGKGFQNTGQKLILSGDSGADKWTGVWKNLRVFDSGGKKIIYTLLMEDITHYRAEYSKNSPEATLTLDDSDGNTDHDEESGVEDSSSGTGTGSGETADSGSIGGNDAENPENSGPGGGAGGTDLPENQEEDAEKDDGGDVSGLLDTENHGAYLRGYPDGSFRPDGFMTRGEAAQMFFNLLKKKGKYSVKAFSDTGKNEWFAEAAGVLAGLGIIEGYEDGTFRGNQPVTRAEFTAIAVRFTGKAEKAECEFSDVPAGSWMYSAVASASEFGWIRGYEDGTFRPQNCVTRAEVCTVTNRMLGRSADSDYLESHRDKIRSFTDLNDNHWAYAGIAEAVNAHSYKKTESGEEWTE